MSEVYVERSCLVFLALAFLLFFFFSIFFFLLLFIYLVFAFSLSTHDSFLLIHAWSTISIPSRHFTTGLLVMIMYIDTKKVSKLGSNGGIALDFLRARCVHENDQRNRRGKINGELRRH